MGMTMTSPSREGAHTTDRRFLQVVAIADSPCYVTFPAFVFISLNVRYVGCWRMYVVVVCLDRVSNDGYKSCRGLRIYSQALIWNSASCRRRVRALRSLSALSPLSLRSLSDLSLSLCPLMQQP